jgi:hypothetical protein
MALPIMGVRTGAVPLDADARDLACELASTPTTRDPIELSAVGVLDVVREDSMLLLTKLSSPPSLITAKGWLVAPQVLESHSETVMPRR